jgi:hypothetical protein
MHEIKNTEFDEAELEKIFALIAVDQARTRQVRHRTGLQMRKIAGKITAQI